MTETKEEKELKITKEELKQKEEIINQQKKIIKTVQLKVVEALPDDAYKGIARIDPEIMRDLGIKRGDIILIKGDRETAAIATVDRAYPTDVGEGIIRIDGIIRRNAKTVTGDFVNVSKAEVKEAKKIVIEPIQKNVVEELKQKDEIINQQKKLTKTATEIARQAALNLGNETRKQVIIAVVAAFGFLIALVWRDTIQGFVEHLVLDLSFNGPPLLLTFYSALITTLIAVVGIILVTKWVKKQDEEIKTNDLTKVT